MAWKVVYEYDYEEDAQSVVFEGAKPYNRANRLLLLSDTGEVNDVIYVVDPNAFDSQWRVVYDYDSEEEARLVFEGKAYPRDWAMSVTVEEIV